MLAYLFIFPAALYSAAKRTGRSRFNWILGWVFAGGIAAAVGRFLEGWYSTPPLYLLLAMPIVITGIFMLHYASRPSLD